MTRPWTLLLLSVAVAAKKQDVYASASTLELKKALYVRGLACDDCDRKALEAKARESDKLPIDLELESLYEEGVKYRRNVEKLNITKEDFLEEMNKTEALDPVRGERVWSAFQSQLESGSVIFLSNGTMQFSMPPTHWLATFLPAPLCDAIEAAYAAARRCYLQLPLKYRRRLEARLDSFVSSGALHGLLILLILIIVGDMIIDLMKDSGKAAETEPAAADTTSRGRTSGANKKKD